MHVLIVTDAYPPMRTSCAVQIYDLAQAFIEEGHQVTIITPLAEINNIFNISSEDGVEVIRVRAFKTKDVNYIYRSLAEFINPFLIWSRLKKSSVFLVQKYDGIIWYSPNIFWGPLIKRLKGHLNVKAYLILRDVFPDWAVDLGILKKGLTYKVLKLVEGYQYEQADFIGVQSPKNLKYLKGQFQSLSRKMEVLWNWIGRPRNEICSINLCNSHLFGRKIFIYLGNMGVAQNIDRLIHLAHNFKEDQRYGFVFVGRGSEVRRLKSLVDDWGLTNTLFFDEISPSEVPSLLQQCSVGVISLDSRHHTHNIPGKFLSYLQAGLPVLALINPGNDLEEIIVANNLGMVCLDPRDDDFSMHVSYLNQLLDDPQLKVRCQNVIKELFFAKEVARHLSELLIKL